MSYYEQVTRGEDLEDEEEPEEEAEEQDDDAEDDTAPAFAEGELDDEGEPSVLDPDSAEPVGELDTMEALAEAHRQLQARQRVEKAAMEEARAEADQIGREYFDEGGQDDEANATANAELWYTAAREVLAERQAERDAGEREPEVVVEVESPFTTMSSADFQELLARVQGDVPVGQRRGAMGDEQFDGLVGALIHGDGSEQVEEPDPNADMDG